MKKIKTISQLKAAKREIGKRQLELEKAIYTIGGFLRKPYNLKMVPGRYFQSFPGKAIS